MVYRHNNREDRRELQSYLGGVKQTCNEPWILIGDSNIVLTMGDRFRGNSISVPEVLDFQTRVSDYKLMELPTKGYRYT